MNSVVFDTPGNIDIRSFTSFGVNSKPMSTSPLGYFGTGLKYAIAILIRTGHKVELYISTDKKYTFYGSTQKFRDKDFDFIRMKREEWSRDVFSWFKPKYEQLPFTTELGKTWKLWEAFRELYTNTLDENGEIYLFDASMMQQVVKNQTRIVVTGPEFVTEYHDRHRNFLPDGLRERTGTERLQVFDKPSNYIYYRGMRVMDLEKPSTLTYNFLCDIALAENRQAASPFTLQNEISTYILECEQEETVKRVLEGKDTYESNINYQWAYRAPSRVFIQASRAASSPNPTATALVSSHEPRKAISNPLEHWPRPWQHYEGGDGESSIIDANSNNVLTFDAEDLSSEAKRYIVALLNKDLTDQEFDQFIRERPADMSLTNTEAEAEMREYEEAQPAPTLYYESEDDAINF